ncbi:ABC transporter ATP-binding protein [Paramaledivibacter caminithermalis]|jgi:ABC-2 type transport system ATP-binding protein|uniref:ABC-2 type transport system ATP-binding protein n=1 Tax=Paramaledivibacter caminithermalis (strain DSM 15212 / CIP 107654 / DViRD3) TaxID=1121301 RepID=A0A1M6LW96_PARC5|nr:ABC transporter ATP-binding protein [Paramaledivibacter caminithermalis]SHJ75430.1 ABC-2 type transport system ATP-binding protein [Paramaledivibacter caminithermalis DSM 15212]
MNTIVSTYNLSKYFNGICRVNEVNLTVYEGDIYGFLGPNGAGKSTTLKMLLGLIKPTKGNMVIFSKNFNKNRQLILSQTGSLIESPSYYEHLTGLENMRILQRLRNVSNKKVQEALHIVRLEKQQNKLVKHYSLGMKQRLGIAMALINFPKLLILDEPTNGLDPNGIREIRELIKSLPQRYGITVLISTHLLSEIEQIATSVGIINDGNLLFQGSMEQLKAKNKAYISIKTQDNNLAKKILLTEGYKFKQNNDRLIFEDLTDSHIAYLNKLFIGQSIDVIRIEEHRKSLEDIFLELTGKERSL